MYKFSELNENKKDTNNEDIRYKLLDIIDKTLRIESYGSARKEILMTTKIVNKEMLVDEILLLFNIISNDSIKESLNDLKNYNKDWYSIDNYINTIGFLEKEDTNKNLINFIETYKSFDNELFLELFKSKFSNENIVSDINSIKTDDVEILEKINILKDI